jgi:hypothetical protein
MTGALFRARPIFSLVEISLGLAFPEKHSPSIEVAVGTDARRVESGDKSRCEV